MLFDRRAKDTRPERRVVTRRIYAYGVLNTVTDVLVSLLPADAKTTAHLEAGERNWQSHSDPLHVVIPLVAAPRIGGLKDVA